MLSEALLYRDELASLSDHQDCETCPGGAACTDSSKRAALGYNWPRCPLALLRSPQLAHVINTFNASKVSPLAGWPDEYAAYIQDGVIALEGATLKKAHETSTQKAQQTPAQFWQAAGVR